MAQSCSGQRDMAGPETFDSTFRHISRSSYIYSYKVSKVDLFLKGKTISQWVDQVCAGQEGLETRSSGVLHLSTLNSPFDLPLPLSVHSIKWKRWLVKEASKKSKTLLVVVSLLQVS